MRRSSPALIALALLSLAASGCELNFEIGGLGGSDAERPEGWQSLEGEQAALRLYYQFVDETRRVRFVERLEEVPEALRATVGFVKLDVAPPLSPGDAARARRARAGGGAAARTASADGTRVVLYSAEWCGACKKAKRYLARRGVAYEERDVDEPRWAQELQRVSGGRAVPVIDVDGRLMTGFSPSGYESLLDS